MDHETLEQLKNLSPETMNAMVLKKLFEIEKKLEQKVAFLLVEDAVELFWRYLQGKKKPRGYRYLLDEFINEFTGQNIAEVTAEGIEGFMLSRWSDSKNNTVRTRIAQLNGLFNHSIKVLMKKGSPVFHNPMELITQPEYEFKEVTFMPPEQIRKIINSVNLDHHWLAMAMLATTGMRANELLGIRVNNINGQVLTIKDPKSGNKEEWAVIPKAVSKVLENYILTNNLQDDDKVIPLIYNNLNKMVKRYSAKCGTPFTSHYFRSWCASFWDEQKDNKMVDITLRHKTGQNRDGRDRKLSRIYIASLPKEVAIERQKVLEKILF